MPGLMTTATMLWLCCGVGVPAPGPAEKAEAPRDTLARGLTAVEESLIKSDNRFGFKLFREITAREVGANVFVSPLSVAMALGMTYNGAGGETAEAMRKTLEIGEVDTEDFNEAYKGLIGLLASLDARVRFDIGNSIWYREEFKFKKSFLDLNRSYFDAEVMGLDFSRPDAAGRINEWVSEKTSEKIKEIVNAPISSEMVMLLINAIYFKGTWTYEFDEKRTRADFFTLPDGSKRPCRMMSQGKEFDYLDNDELQAIDLPYGDGMFRMTVLLPKEGNDVDSLISGFNEVSWRQWLEGLRRMHVVLELPRFKMEYQRTLNDVLKSMGMGIAFKQAEADFSGMCEGPEPLSISEVKHKTFVQVDEEGTEAAAVTSVGIVTTSVRPTARMRVDRPFVFAIRDSRSQALLFMGKIVEPTWEE